MRRPATRARLCAAALLLLPSCAFTAELQPLALPKPRTGGGKPLMQVLNERKSAREFSSEKLSPQVLSGLLWAAWGINRPDGRRTAPSASNRQEIDIYVATAEAVWLFDARAHRLAPVVAKDLRALTGGQPFVAEAPVNLVYVADFARMGSGSEEDKILYSAADTGFISENVYLYCASEGLATVVRGTVNRAELARALGLRPEQRIILAQTLGYARK